MTERAALAMGSPPSFCSKNSHIITHPLTMYLSKKKIFREASQFSDTVKYGFFRKVVAIIKNGQICWVLNMPCSQEGK